LRKRQFFITQKKCVKKASLFFNKHIVILHSVIFS
jgi:hypothetical protein